MSKKRNYHIAILSIFLSIILIQNIIPFLGYIPVGPLSITIIPITVIIGTLMLGLKDGIILGTFWGVIDFIRAFTWPTSALSPLIFTNPITAVIPRLMISVTTYYVFKILINRFGMKFSAVIASGLGSMTNTILVLGLIYLFDRSKSELMYHVNMQQLLPYLIGIMGTNGLIEMIFAMIICPIIVIPLMKKFKK